MHETENNNILSGKSKIMITPTSGQILKIKAIAKYFGEQINPSWGDEIFLTKIAPSTHYHEAIEWIWPVAKKASEDITKSVIASTKYPDEIEGRAMFLKAEINSALICFNIQKLFNATYESILFINEHIQQQ